MNAFLDWTKKLIRLKVAGLEQRLLKSDLFGDGEITALGEEIISLCGPCQCERSAAPHLLLRGGGEMTE